MSVDDNYWTRRRLSRRGLLRASGIGFTGLVGAALIGCGDDDDEPAAGATGTPTSGSSQPTASATTAPAGAFSQGGSIAVGITGEPRSLDPHTGVGGDEHSYAHLVYDSVIKYNQQGVPDPTLSLAESWEYADSLTLNLKIRPGVEIEGNGESVDGELIKWNLDRARSEGTTSAPDLAAIESVDVVGPTEVVVHLNQPSAPLLTSFGDRGGFVVSRKHYEDVGADEFVRNPLGSGPFNLTSFVSDASLTYERNKSYWRKDAAGGSLPYLDTIELKIIPDNTVRVAALETGEIDITATPSADFNRLNGNSDLHSSTFNGSNTGILYINDRFPPMDNVRFRMALSQAIDRKSYINNFLLGVEEEARGLLTPASWAYDSSIEGYHYNPAEVQKLLQASGLPESEWKVTAQPRAAARTDFEEFLDASITGAGIQIEWKDGVSNAFGLHFMTSFGAPESTPWGGSAAMLASGWSMRVDPDGSLGQFYLGSLSRYNASQQAAPELEPLVIKGRQALDLDERKEIYSELTKLSLEYLYALIPTQYGVSVTHAQKRVVNLTAVDGGEGKDRWADLAVEA